MKPETEKGIDDALEARKKAYIQALANKAMREYVKAQVDAELEIHNRVLTPDDWMVINKAALTYHSKYTVMLEKEGASIIQGRKVPWMKDMDESTRKQVSDIIKKGIEEGKPTGVIETKKGTYPAGSIAADLHGYFDDRKSHAAMVARSEVTRIQNVAKLERWQDRGFDRSSVLDDEGPNSCDPCAKANGQVWTIEYALSHEKQHPNCVRRFSAAREDVPLTDESEFPEEAVVMQLRRFYFYDPDQARDDSGKWSSMGGGGGGAGALASAARAVMPTGEGESTPAPVSMPAPAGDDKTRTQSLLAKRESYKKETVKVHGRDVTVHAHQDLAPDTRRRLEAGISHITPEQAANIQHIEIHPANESYGFDVGQSKFTSAGHWDNENKSIRVFGDDNVTERVISHEAAHAQFDAMETKERDLSPPDQQQKGIQAFEQMETTRKAEVDKVYSKYQDKFKTFDDALSAKRQEQRDYSGSTRDPGYQKLRKEESNIKRQWTRSYHQQEKEIASVRETYDPEKEYERVAHPNSGLRDRQREFQDAVSAEGGVTPYADAYVKSHHINYRTEAYAALRERELGVTPGADSWMDYKKKYPRSTSAYENLNEEYKKWIK